MSMVLTWIEKNLTWLIPCFFSVLFSTFNIILLSMQRKSHKAETKQSNDLFLAQLNILQTQKNVHLLDHRLTMYNSVIKSFQTALGDSRVDEEMVQEFLRATMFADFLFDEKVATFCHQLSDTFRKKMKIRSQQKSSEAAGERDKYLKKVDEEFNLDSELMDQLENMKDLFSPFFKFQDIEFQVEMVRAKKAEKRLSTSEEQVS